VDWGGARQAGNDTRTAPLSQPAGIDVAVRRPSSAPVVPLFFLIPGSMNSWTSELAGADTPVGG
jgi:hypothetical protein